MTRRQPKQSKRNKARDADVDSDDESHSLTSDVSHITADSITSQQSRGSNASSAASRKGRGSEEEVVTSVEDQFAQAVDDLEEKRARWAIDRRVDLKRKW